MKKIILIIVSLIVTTPVLFGQQLNTVSQYSQDYYLINPAYAGATKNLPVTGIYKQFFSGLAGSPTYQSLSGHMLVVDNMGAGGRIFNYQAGPISKTGIEGSYAYVLDLNGSGMKLSLGLSAQMSQFYLNKSMLFLEDANDNSVTYATDKMITPDFNFGGFFFDEEKGYYAGLSIYQLLGRSTDMMNDDYLTNSQVRHYFFNGGYKYKINDDIMVEPSIMLKFIESGITQIDINASVLYKKLVYAGLSYRTNNAIAFMFGVKAQDFFFGYAYDYNLSALKSYSVGSHELMVSYTFGKVSRSEL